MGLRLHVPAYEELWYRQRLMADPATMSYNRGYEDFPGYDRETGCIDFPESEWRDWYDWFIGQEPKRFYAYIVGEDGQFIGDVNVHQNDGDAWYEMGVVLEAGYRGRGYSREALELLLRHAFTVLNAKAVRNSFEAERTAAVRAHLAAGFREIGREEGVVYLEITREEYEHEVSGGIF